MLFPCAALIPLAEEEEVGTQRQYNLKNDEEVQSCLKEAASAKKVMDFSGMGVPQRAISLFA